MTGIITKLCKDDDGCVEVTTDNRKWLNWMKAVIPILSDGTRSDRFYHLQYAVIAEGHEGSISCPNPEATRISNIIAAQTETVLTSEHQVFGGMLRFSATSINNGHNDDNPRESTPHSLPRTSEHPPSPSDQQMLHDLDDNVIPSR